MPPDEVEKGILNQPERVSELLKKIHKESGARSKQVIASLPISSVFSTIINLPRISKKELASPRNLAPLIHWEAKKLIPLPLNEMILDWQVIPTSETKQKTRLMQNSEPPLEKTAQDAAKKKHTPQEPQTLKNTRVLLNAAAKELVEKYVRVFKQAGLQLVSLEPDNAALIRSLIGNDPSTAMIIDIGAKTTNLLVIDNKIPYLNKSIHLGGVSFTRAISEQLQVEYGRAEQFKIDLSKSADSAFPRMLESNLVDVLNEVTYLTKLFGSSHAKSIEKIILTGGSSLLPELSYFLEEKLHIRVYLGDPWARVIFPPDLRPVLDELGPRFAVAIGLVMRKFHS